MTRYIYSAGVAPPCLRLNRSSTLIVGFQLTVGMTSFLLLTRPLWKHVLELATYAQAFGLIILWPVPIHHVCARTCLQRRTRPRDVLGRVAMYDPDIRLPGHEPTPSDTHSCHRWHLFNRCAACDYGFRFIDVTSAHALLLLLGLWSGSDY